MMETGVGHSQHQSSLEPSRRPCLSSQRKLYIFSLVTLAFCGEEGEKGSHYIALADLDLTVETKLAPNLGLVLPIARIKPV